MKQRRLRRVGDHVESVELAQRGGERAGVAEELRHPRRALLESRQCRRDQPGQLRQCPAVAPAPDPRLIDHLGRPGQHAAADAPETLVERHVDGVKQRCQLGGRALVVRGGLPDPGAVEMQRDAPRSRPLNLRLQLLERRQPPAELALGQLQQQRAERPVQRLQVLERDQPVAITDELGAQAVQLLVATVLVQLEVAGGMKRDGVGPARVAVDPQRDLLGHRPAREHGRRLEAEQLRKPRLERLDELAVAVAVGPVVGAERGRRRAQLIGHRLRRRRAQPALTAAADLLGIKPSARAVHRAGVPDCPIARKPRRPSQRARATDGPTAIGLAARYRSTV